MTIEEDLSNVVEKAHEAHEDLEKSLGHRMDKERGSPQMFMFHLGAAVAGIEQVRNKLTELCEAVMEEHNE